MGIKKVYIAPYEDVKHTVTDGVITLDNTKFKEYNFRKQTASFNTEATIDDVNGVCYFTSTLELKFTKLESTKRLEISTLVITDVEVVVEDMNGNLFYLGYDNAVTSTAAGQSSGTNYGDFSGYTITLEDMSKTLPYSVTWKAA